MSQTTFCQRFRNIWPVALLWSMTGLLMMWAMHLRHPLMFFMRPFETPLLIAIGLLGSVLAFRAWHRTVWFSTRIRHGVTLGLMLTTLALTITAELRFQMQRREVLSASWDMRAIGRHFVIGFRDWDVLPVLAERGLIGGIYLNSRNVEGLNVRKVRDKISHLQAIRAKSGLPPLLIAADQEGGKIAHLSPLLPRTPALSSIAHLPPSQAADTAYEYGLQQGKSLAGVGVNLNLSPVVDLKPAKALSFDTHTLISQRAIAADSRIVENIAHAYSAGLEAAGVQPTLKHFPGLGQVRQDTHHRAARLDLPADVLAKDWSPFREVSRETGAAIMLGHVVLGQLDPQHAVSHSERVVQRVIRQEWGYGGLLITDDLNMGAVYGKGIGIVAAEALNAGVDLILVSYDPDQYFPAVHTAAKRLFSGGMNKLRLAQSDRRLAVRFAPKTLPGKSGQSVTDEAASTAVCCADNAVPLSSFKSTPLRPSLRAPAISHASLCAASV